MEKTEFKTKDGRYLYKVNCPQCGVSRGLQPKKLANTLCRPCSATNYRKAIPQNRSKESYLPNNKQRSKYPNVNMDDVKRFPCGHKEYRMTCLSCGKDRGYQALQAANKNCRQCMGIKSSNKTTNNIDWSDSIRIGNQTKYRQTCLNCGSDRGYHILKQFDSPCDACKLLGIQRIRPIRKKIKSTMKSSIYHRLQTRKISKNRKKTFDMLPYTIDELMTHLESLFKPGMTWENQGQWHIDHITPDSWFSYSSMDDQGFKDSWALSNLQPLWAIDNLRKSNKYSG